MANIIDGKQLSKILQKKIKSEVDSFFDKSKRYPLMVLIQVGENTESSSYIRLKMKACDRAGILHQHITYSENITTDCIINSINSYNKLDNYDGILVQLPLPKHLNQELIMESINPNKDVDGFHSTNISKLLSGNDINTFMIPPTPMGCLQLIKHADIPLVGKHVVIIGRSNLVGKPLASLLLSFDATITICHSKTRNIKNITKNADILIVAVGTPHMVKEDWIKPGACVIDVGITYLDDNTTKRGYKIYGDVDFENVKKIAGHITTVPGGVGPMTITMLLYNVLKSAKNTI
jgi:methylenetetrahydrofolate dehydrogenase (NADP+) / methenyltetrahydrofolate cyclohydrolase